ncbi:hypothetical protein BJ875DRAFT_1308 [Amylocarpus encephaloides]|uniref:Uncharacterized protein n=1 Tax=Amylocarpus encephaloides TaxID=45428 RepID=A0A9P7YU33_9HELO|nr:hypothetical protein BJ875DRAFT_1308 [Amylocarpus encephaloides]
MSSNNGAALVVFGLRFSEHHNLHMQQVLREYDRPPTAINRGTLFTGLHQLSKELSDSEAERIQIWLKDGAAFPFLEESAAITEDDVMTDMDPYVNENESADDEDVSPGYDSADFEDDSSTDESMDLNDVQGPIQVQHPQRSITEDDVMTYMDPYVNENESADDEDESPEYDSTDFEDNSSTNESMDLNDVQGPIPVQRPQRSEAVYEQDEDNSDDEDSDDSSDVNFANDPNHPNHPTRASRSYLATAMNDPSTETLTSSSEPAGGPNSTDIECDICIDMCAPSSFPAAFKVTENCEHSDESRACFACIEKSIVPKIVVGSLNQDVRLGNCLCAVSPLSP